MKTFKKYDTAKKAALALNPDKPLPVVKFGSGDETIYLVYEGTEIGLRITEVALITAGGGYAGHITMDHLDRLGNANHAKDAHPVHYKAFPKEVV